MGGMMGGLGSGFGGLSGFGVIGMILNLVIAIGLVVGLVLLVVWLWRRINLGESSSAAFRRPVSSEALPKEILQIRYARGEITREQYLQMRADLT